MSRFPSIAAAIGLIVVVAACSPAPSASPGSSPPAASGPGASSPAASGPVASGATGGTQFAGVTVNLLTFNGPQVAEPLQRRAPAFEAATGARINVVAVGFQEIYDIALLDAASGTNSFDAYVFDPQWMGDFVTPGYLEDITDRVNSDAGLQWQDIGPFFRDFNATYGGRVYTIPLDGDFHMVYYRSDQIQNPPKTWDEYLQIA